MIRESCYCDQLEHSLGVEAHDHEFCRRARDVHSAMKQPVSSYMQLTKLRELRDAYVAWAEEHI